MEAQDLLPIDVFSAPESSGSFWVWKTMVELNHTSGSDSVGIFSSTSLQYFCTPPQYYVETILFVT